MEYITGEKFQSLCNPQISINEFMPYELDSDNLVNVYDFDFNYDNSPLVYVNLDLIKGPIKAEDLNEESKSTLIFDKEVDLIKKLSLLKNPFSLILHNNDAAFESKDLNLLDIPNCRKIYTQNCTVEHPDIIPIPIGLGNFCWPYGDLDLLSNIKIKNNKEDFIYFNFTLEGGCRDVKRPDCYEKCKKLDIPWIENSNQSEYLNNLNNYKFIVSPEGNGIDCHRTWEALYLKVIPIVDRNYVTEYFSKLFPMVLVDDWKDFNTEGLEDIYKNADWKNYNLLDFSNFISYINLNNHG